MVRSKKLKHGQSSIESEVKKSKSVSISLIERQIIQDKTLIRLNNIIPIEEKRNTLRAFYIETDRRSIILINRSKKICADGINITFEQLNNLVLYFWISDSKIQPTKEDMKRLNDYNNHNFINPLDLQKLKDRTIHNKKQDNL